ncbi:MAG TPA: NUDIX hydrolase [Planktothrix sp.]
MAVFTTGDRKQSRRVYEGGIINLRVDTLAHDNGQTVIRELVEHNGGVVIACRPQPDQIILIRQYRYSCDGDLVELPAGRIEKGEEPLLAAQRELTEETGYKAKSWRKIGQMYSAPGFCNEILYMYEAQELTFLGKNLDPDEETDVIILGLAEAWRMALSGELQDAKTIAGLGLLMGTQLS